MQVSGNKLVKLSPLYQPDFINPIDINADVKTVFADPLLTPTNPNVPVTVTENGQPVTVDDIVKHFEDSMDIVNSPADQKWCKEFCDQTMIYNDPTSTMTFDEIFSQQAGVEAQLRLPSATAIYSPGKGLKTACKEFVSGVSTPEKLFAWFAFCSRPTSLGFYCKDDTVFDAFKAYVDMQVQAIAQNLTADTVKCFQDFQGLNMKRDLTEDLILRSAQSPQDDAYSFPRMLHRYALDYCSVASPDDFGCMPFSASELLHPETMLFVNVDAHARAPIQKIVSEWTNIQKALQMPVQQLSHKQLTKLTAKQKQLQRATMSAAANLRRLADLEVNRVLHVKFSATRPNVLDISKRLMKIMENMTSQNRTMNVYRQVKNTYSKPNRRDPMNYDKMGRSVSRKYRPNLHVYIDTSGSISERDYEDSVKTIIKMAKKFNVDMYVTFFSHMLSPTYKLQVEGRSSNAIYNSFRKLEKVDGGTNYVNVWNYINARPERKRELSVMITDFEFTAPSQFIPHPKNLYYAPCSTISWSRIVSDAKYFLETAVHNDPHLRTKLLF